ncbi:MAG: AlpA family phage regulatory protein [Desulfovibrionaceae bacterium]|nr:AlpA family phage regulatory protein [Desulfovibrionaceae bacterium]
MNTTKQQTLPALPSEGFVRLPQVLAIIPVSRTQFWQGIKDGRFPAPIKLGVRTSAWRVEDIRALIKTLTEGSGV